jgi:hypothetical protein
MWFGCLAINGGFVETQLCERARSILGYCRPPCLQMAQSATAAHPME